MVMYTDPGGPEPSTQDRFVDRFRLPNGQTVIILIQEHPISERDAQQLEASRRAITDAVRQGPEAARSALEAWLEPRTWLYGNNEIGTRFFVDVSGGYLFEE